MAQFRGEVDEAASKAERATELGQRFGDRDLVAMGIHLQGLARISAGGVAEGMALLDEAMTSVVAGELNPYFTGVIYCNVLSICLELADLARAAEWNKAATAWCESLPEDAPFPGLCRLNRIEAANLRGAWSDAESEARRASEELTFNPRAAGHAFYETGEIRRRIGNFAGAEEAFTRAHELGFDPQPGLALLRLAQGKAEAALGALRLAVAGASGSRLRRTRLLAAQVEVALAAGDLDAARTASRELETIAGDFGTPALEAGAATARGALRLAEGEVPEAIEALRNACVIWRDLRLPYEAAQTRALYGLALRKAGHEEDAPAGAPRRPGGVRPSRRRRRRRQGGGPAGGAGSPAGRAHGARGRGAPPGRHGQDQPRGRRGAHRQRAHRRAAPPEHLRQAGRLVAGGRDGLRGRAWPRLSPRTTARAHRWSILTTTPHQPIGWFRRCRPPVDPPRVIPEANQRGSGWTPAVVRSVSRQ